MSAAETTEVQEQLENLDLSMRFTNQSILLEYL